MNVIKINNKTYKYESFWRPSKKKEVLDFNDEPLPFPTEGKEWQNRDIFIEQLRKVQEYLRRDRKHIEYERDNFKNCLLCHKKNITTGIFEIDDMRWEDGLIHYIKVHKIKPSVEFMDKIFSFQMNPNSRQNLGTIISSMGNIKSTMKRMNDKIYLKLSRNQIHILDALMEHGTYKKYVHNANKRAFYSEHAGLFDFNNTGLERIIIKGNTEHIPKSDDIFLPGEWLPGELDFEYVFHTHPPTEGIGGRVATDNVLYEFPSVGDINNFIEAYNENQLQGSIVIAPEGMYIIRKHKMDNNKIKKTNKFTSEARKKANEIQNLAIKKYDIEVDQVENKSFVDKDEFFNHIAQDKEFINLYNDFLNKIGVHIDYYPRIKDKFGFWIIDTIYLPIYVVEPDFNIG